MRSTSSFVYTSQPQRVVFGAGSITHLAREIAALGARRALVLSTPEQRAHRVARDLHAGMVWINSYKRVNPGSPFGGVGQSGYGREMGFDAMREYTQVKSVWVNVDAQIPPHFKR